MTTFETLVIAQSNTATPSITLWSHAPAVRLSKQIANSKTILASDHVIVARADAVLDQPLLEALLLSPGTAIKADHGELIVLAAHVQKSLSEQTKVALETGAALPDIVCKLPSEMNANFWKALRKKETPYAMQVSASNKSDVEWRMFMGTYKGATDLVTKHAWPRPAFYVTRFLASLGVTPNMVTWVGLACTILAFERFWAGDFALGLVAAWAMTFLDTVDGKLARTTLTSTKLGDVFDHGIDLVHPPFWYAAWGFAVLALGHITQPQLYWLLAIILGGYVVQRLMEGVAIGYLGLEIHIWRKIDTFFRQITARRNPNLILLTVSVLINKPDWGLYAVAAWTLICLVLHGVQLLQALAIRRATGRVLESWMMKP